MTIAVPPLAPSPELRIPPLAERVLDNGLTVIAVQRSSVPLAEIRLRIPYPHADLARALLQSQTLFSGTATMSTVQIAAELQKVGGGLGAGLDPDRLLISGNALVDGLPRLLEILAHVLDEASYPTSEVDTERDRLADRIHLAQSQPAHLVRVAMLKRVYPGHPYEVQTPSVAQVRAVQPEHLRAVHAQRTRPAGSVAVIVGDLEPERALGLVETALGGWRGAGPDLTLPPAPPLEPGPLTLVDRPGSVQSSIRLALPAVERTHPDHAALVLANLIFGGYFSSRWVENVRERKGYSYGPHSLIEHSVAGSLLTVSAEVATEVSAPAMLETWYELGRLALVPPIQAELDQARQYALGTLQLGMASQAGLASLAINYAGVGLRLPFLADHAARLAAVTRDELTAVAAAYLAPSRAAAVVLGDAAVAVDSLSRIGAVIREELDEVDSEPAYGAPAGRDDRTERGADHGAGSGSGGDNDRTGSGADERRTGTAAVSRADDSGP